MFFRDNDYEPLQKLPSFESNTNVSLQLGNSTIPCVKNASITKTYEKTSQSFHHGNLFKQPDVNYAKNQRNIALNTKVCLTLLKNLIVNFSFCSII